VADIVTKAPDS